VFGILLLSPAMDRLWGRLAARTPFSGFLTRPAVRGAVSGGLAITLATYPLLGYYFYWFQPWSFFVNLLVGPSVALLVILALVTGAAGLFSLTAARFLAGSVMVMLRLYEGLCRIVAGLPGSPVLTGCCGLTVAVSAVAALLLFRHWFAVPVGAVYRRRGMAFAAGMAVFVICVAIRVWPQGPRLTMVDVGQGDAFVWWSGRDCFVLDGGPGVAAVGPYLDYLGYETIDGMFASHGDADHAAGLVDLVDSRPVKNLYIPADLDPRAGDAPRLLGDATKYGVPIRALAAGDRLTSGPFAMDVLYPFDGQSESSTNASSLVLRLTCENNTILFTGDIPGQVERELVDHYGPSLSSDILKLAHHGSKTSNTEEFLDAVQPVASLVSTGRGNRYGFPAKEVVDDFTDRGIQLYNTGDDGAVTVKFSRNGYTITTMLP